MVTSRSPRTAPNEQPAESSQLDAASRPRQLRRQCAFGLIRAGSGAGAGSCALVVAVGVVVVAGLAVAVYMLKPVNGPARDLTLVGDATRGAYLMRLGGCVTCHTDSQGRRRHARRRPGAHRRRSAPSMPPTSPRIRSAGIGSWTLAQFSKAMSDGEGPQGHLYPAFPYENYTLMSDQEIADLFAALQAGAAGRRAGQAARGRLPVQHPAGAGGLEEPVLHSRSATRPTLRNPSNGTAAATWSFGPGHCVMCHSPRNLLGALETDQELTGNPAGGVGGKAPALDGRGACGRRLRWNDAGRRRSRTGFTPDLDVLGERHGRGDRRRDLALDRRGPRSSGGVSAGEGVRPTRSPGSPALPASVISVWCSQAGSVSGKSVRKWPPRLSVRLSAAAATSVAEVVMLRKERVTPCAVASSSAMRRSASSQARGVALDADEVGHDVPQVLHRLELAQVLLVLPRPAPRSSRCRGRARGCRGSARARRCPRRCGRRRPPPRAASWRPAGWRHAARCDEASPQTHRPGQRRAAGVVDLDAAHVVVRRRRHRDRLGHRVDAEIGAVLGHGGEGGRGSARRSPARVSRKTFRPALICR